MLTGYNTNFAYRGVKFHVQTEDSGRSKPHIITHLFHGGTILASDKADYSTRLDSVNLSEEVKSLMEAQHKEMLRRLTRGELDSQLRERLGDDVFPGP
jgi:predicted ThiF/HesA family dinucleotide-utilizing enzyme